MKAMHVNYTVALCYLYNQYHEDFQCYDGIYMPIVLICVETNWSGSCYAMAVLGCRSIVLVLIIIRWRNEHISQSMKNHETQFHSP